MQHISTTPFGRRMMDAGLMAARQMAETTVPNASIDKYEILTALTRARAAFSVSNRDLAVLSALVSFHPVRELAGDDLIVFPSNAALSERAHGMAESTLRRHLRALVQAGLILRHDSPNGKRYATQGRAGGLRVAFGFDLRPLVLRADEILTASRAAQEAAEALRRLRERVVLSLRDARKLIDYASETQAEHTAPLAEQLQQLTKRLRRKLNRRELDQISELATHLLNSANALFPPPEATEMNGNDDQNERHIQYSTRTLDESECAETNPGQKDEDTAKPVAETRLPLSLVLKATPDLQDYASDGLGDWYQFVATAAFVRGMLGITEHAWSEACRVMGDIHAAITVACILQRADRIARPGGYLRALSARAADHAFSPGPMVMALLRADNLKTV